MIQEVAVRECGMAWMKFMWEAHLGGSAQNCLSLRSVTRSPRPHANPAVDTLQGCSALAILKRPHVEGGQACARAGV
jgi:hypothetical protein